MKSIFDLRTQSQSIRRIAETLVLARNTVRKYLRSPEIHKPKPRPERPSKIDPYREYIQSRLADGVDNCAVLLRELREQGYTGGYCILKEYVKPFRRPKQPIATVRFETLPGQQAQVDFGVCKYRTPDGKTRRIWVLVMVLSWSRAIYAEFIPRANVAAFIRSHINAFRKFGGVPRHILYDNTKNVVLDRDEAGNPLWNERFLDFALRVGFGIKLCRPYRAQTKGRVESGVKYVKRNFWPSPRFTGLDDLNRQVQAWAETVADQRIHGTTHERPADRLAREFPHLMPAPAPDKVAPFLREERTVGRDGFVQWDKAWYGVPWQLAGQTVEVEPKEGTVEIWFNGKQIAVHPRATTRGQRFVVPGQWAGMPLGDGRKKQESLAVQLPTVEVQRRSLKVYDALLEGVSAQ